MEPITLTITILAPVQKVWDYFTKPEHIRKWLFANREWHCPKAENDLRDGGTFNYRMEAKDGSFGFDYAGNFDKIEPPHILEYHLGDGRKAAVHFTEKAADTTKVTFTFDPEGNNPRDMQRNGWYNILDHFHKYVEQH